LINSRISCQTLLCTTVASNVHFTSSSSEVLLLDMLVLTVLYFPRREFKYSLGDNNGDDSSIFPVPLFTCLDLVWRSSLLMLKQRKRNFKVDRHSSSSTVIIMIWGDQRGWAFEIEISGISRQIDRHAGSCTIGRDAFFFFKNRFQSTVKEEVSETENRNPGDKRCHGSVKQIVISESTRPSSSTIYIK
jgi:hypothetical protein